MDTPALFDTHASVKRLITAGLTESIAEALVEEQQKWHNNNLANLATKQDVALLMKDTESLRQEVKIRTDSLTDQITNLKWLIGLMFGVLLAFNGFMLAIIKFL